MIYLDLLWRFVVISLLAFGGGQAALPLVERTAVNEARWITPAVFGTGVALAYLTPGPVMIVATFVGYNVAGVTGAFTATVGAFLAPWGLAVLLARQVTRFAQHPWLRGFGRTAAPAVVGLLALTVADIARGGLQVSWPHMGLAGVVLVLAARTPINPALLLALGGAVGYLIG